MIEKRNVPRRAVRPVDRQRMRPWLIALLNDRSVNGLQWINKKSMIFEVKWRHGARQGWSISKDADIFERWARHTGKFQDGEEPDPKRWKANFRCALNSLPDIVEEKKESNTKGNNAYRVYRMLNESEKKCKKNKKTIRVKYEEPMDLKSDGEDSFTSGDQIPSSPETETDFDKRIPDFCQIDDSYTKNYHRINSLTGCSGGNVIVQDGSFNIKTEPFDWTKSQDGTSPKYLSHNEIKSFYFMEIPQRDIKSDLDQVVVEIITDMEILKDNRASSPNDTDEGSLKDDIPQENWNADFHFFDTFIEPAVVTVPNEDTCPSGLSESTALASLDNQQTIM